jgi:predicted amidophosphoribosyltransferase
MKVNVRQIVGNWTAGYALDKHTLSSTYIGDNDFGRPQFDTNRSEAGEALFRLKFRGDWNQVPLLASAMVEEIIPRFPKPDLILPMPASNQRLRQPVTELARAIAALAAITVEETLLTKLPTSQLKDLTSKDEKVAVLAGRFQIHDVLQGDGRRNVLLMDDLFDTGASMEGACSALQTYPKIGNIYVATVSWR